MINTMTSSETGQRAPLISIGMPVRNEGKFLARALDTLVAQAGVNLEIFISDNASTDNTAEICEDYRARHSFIRYHRFEHNVGASANFHHVLHQTKGEYFMWASGHDLWDDNYLAECSRLLNQQPGAVIAFGATHWIDAEGKPFSRETGFSDTRGLSVIARYFTVFWGNMNPIIAMIRARDLKQQDFNDMVGVDLAILLALSLRGDFVHSCHTNWYRREFRKEASYQQKLERYRSADYALSTSFMGRYFPLARLPLRIVSDLYASGLSFGMKLLIMLILLPSFPVKYLVDKSRKSSSEETANNRQDSPA
jgi:glycosyltransferase involved in cell wall biosynthesis